MTINIVSKSNPRLAQRYGSSVRSVAGINAKKGAGFFEFDVHRELFLSGEQGLWLDPADMSRAKTDWRRNLFTYSETFTSPSLWSLLDCTSSKNATDPNGVVNSATTITRNSTAYGGLYVYQPTNGFAVTAGLSYTFSIFLKAGTASSISVSLETSGTGGAVFTYTGVSVNLSNGTITSGSGGTITAFPDGWYRVTVTEVAVATGTAEPGIYSSGTSNFALNGTMLIWGAQFESGAATSYQKIGDFSNSFKAAFPLHTLYQDSTGLTPCTAAGDPVGLIIDKSLGGLKNLGVQIVTNGGFDSDSVWTKDSGWTISGGVASITNPSTDTRYLRHVASASREGRFYKITIDILSLGAGPLEIRLGSNASGNGVIQINTTGSHTVIGNWTGSGTEFYIRGTALTGTYTIDNVSISEIPGNHAYQNTSGSRPTLGRLPSSTGGVRNLITYSDELDNAAWTKVNGTISANTITSYDGSTTADLFVCNTTNSTHDNRRNETVKTSTTYTLSAYAKAQNYNFLWLNIVNPSIQDYQCWFNVSNGTVGTVAAGATAKIESVGNGWYRCQMTLTTTASQTTTIVVVAVSNADNTVSFAGDNVSGVYIDKIQFEESPTATNYQKVRSTYDISEVGANDCWYLYFDGSDDFLQTNSIGFHRATVGARTNLTIDSEFLIASTGVTVVGRADATTGLNSITKNDATTPRYAYSLGDTSYTPTPSTTYTASARVKYNGYNTNVSLEYNQSMPWGISWVAVFDVTSSGVTVFSQSSCIASVVNEGSGVYRIIATFTTASSVSAGSTSILIRITGAAGVSVYAGQIQLEIGSSATTYQKVGTDEMTVVAGVRKLLDINEQIYELSANSFSNAGVFSLNNNTSGIVGHVSAGTAVAGANTPTYSSLAPFSAIWSLSAHISLDACLVRQNGAQNATSSSDQGTGNYGNHILYIGRRAGTSMPFNGHVYGLIIRGRSSSTDLISNTEKFIARNTGLII